MNSLNEAVVSSTIVAAAVPRLSRFVFTSSMAAEAWSTAEITISRFDEESAIACVVISYYVVVGCGDILSVHLQFRQKRYVALMLGTKSAMSAAGTRISSRGRVIINMPEAAIAIARKINPLRLSSLYCPQLGHFLFIEITEVGFRPFDLLLINRIFPEFWQITA